VAEGRQSEKSFKPCKGEIEKNTGNFKRNRSNSLGGVTIFGLKMFAVLAAWGSF